jgi:hypothetical protein
LKLTLPSQEGFFIKIIWQVKIKSVCLQKMDTNKTYGWVFHIDMEGRWCAAKREYYFELFNGDMGHVFRSHDPNVLREIIEKTGGDKIKIQKLLDESNG